MSSKESGPPKSDSSRAAPSSIDGIESTSATTLSLAHVRHPEEKGPVADRTGLADHEGLLPGDLAGLPKRHVSRNAAKERHRPRKLQATSRTTDLELAQTLAESPTKDKSFNESATHATFEGYEAIYRVATNHFRLDLSSFSNAATRPVILYEYSMRITPGYFGNYSNPPRLSKEQKKLIVAAGLQHMQSEGRYPVAAMTTDYEHTLLSMQSLHKARNGRFYLPLCASRYNHASGDFTITFELRKEWQLDEHDGLRDLDDEDWRHSDSFGGSKRQVLMDLLVSRHIDGHSFAHGAKGEWFSKSQSEALKADGKRTDLSLVRSFGAKVVSPGTTEKFLQVVPYARPCFDPRILEELLWRFKNANFATSDKGAYESIEVALRGTSMRIGSRARTLDSYGSELRPYLDEPLHSIKPFVGLGERDPPFSQQRYRQVSNPFERLAQEDVNSQRRRNKNLDKLRPRRMIEYQKDRHDWQKSSFPAANLANKAHPEWFSSSKLTVLPYQRFNGDLEKLCKSKTPDQQVLLSARRDPAQRLSLISEFISEAFKQNNTDSIPLLCNRLMLSKKLVSIRAKLLKLPMIEHARSSSQLEDNGSWRYHKERYSKDAPERSRSCNGFKKPFSKRLNVGVIFNHGSKNDLNTRGRVNLLLAKLRDAGLTDVCITEESYRQMDKHTSALAFGEDIERKTQSLGNPGLVILYSERPLSPSRYAAFKRSMDLTKRRASVCLVVDENFSSKICGVAAKINAKLCNSYNHMVDLHADERCSLEDTMILGASLRHPDNGACNGAPSVISLVSCHAGRARTQDDFGLVWGSFSLQTSHSAALRKETSIETIRDLGSLARPHFQAFRDTHGHFPLRVIYYRTGMDEYSMDYDMRHEIEGLRRECMSEKKLTCSLTAIVVKKQSKVRFFPLEEHRPGSTDANCTPGTVIDTDMTPDKSFFLQSHYASQGTARPTLYNIVCDDNKFSDYSIQNLTFRLCFGSQTATQPLSQPAPTYYAGKLASRVKLWLNDVFHKDSIDPLDEQLRLSAIASANVTSTGSSTVSAYPILDDPEYNLPPDGETEEDNCERLKAILRACEDSIYKTSSPQAEAQSNRPANMPLNKCMFWL